MGGTDDASNLVELTVEEHAEAHRDNISKSKLKNPNNKEIASKAGKASAEKYKKDPLRQQAHSERMKKWWDEKRKVGT